MDFNYNSNVNSVHYLTATYQEIVNAFGDGTIAPRDDYKQEAQWDINTSQGFVEIYDYKVGKCYDPDGLNREDITVWHVQGASREAIEEMLQMLGDAN